MSGRKQAVDVMQRPTLRHETLGKDEQVASDE